MASYLSWIVCWWRERERGLQGKGLATQRKGGKDWPDPQQKPKTNLREKLAIPSQDQETKELKKPKNKTDQSQDQRKQETRETRGPKDPESQEDKRTKGPGNPKKQREKKNYPSRRKQGSKGTTETWGKSQKTRRNKETKKQEKIVTET